LDTLYKSSSLVENETTSLIDINSILRFELGLYVCCSAFDKNPALKENMKLNFKKLRIPKTELRAFILTLIATLAGVFIAIVLTNSGIQKKEKEDTIKLLNTSRLILTNTKKYSQGLNRTVKKLEKDTINNSYEKISEMKETNPIPFPYLLETVITNEIVSKNISEYSHTQIYTGLINLKKLANYQTAGKYEQSLAELIILMDLEIQYQKGKLDVDEIENRIKTKREELKKLDVNKNILEIRTE
jgi:hypothetical protein